MRAHAHILAAWPLAAGLLGLTVSPSAALAGAVASVVMDLDHVLDYLWWRGGWRGAGDFFRSYYQRQVTRMTVPLHSWEMLPLLALGLHWMDWPQWGWCLALGWSWHLAWDQFTNPLGRYFYFFTWRARHGFRKN